MRSADRTALAKERAARLIAEGEELCPAVAHGKKIASSFWGYAWCRAIERWQDYESRLPAGRSLLRAGTVIDLRMEPGMILAKVSDDELYDVRINLDPPEEELLDTLRSRCTGRIGSIMDLVNGTLSEDTLAILSDPENGLFPEYGAINPICNCIDDACLCSHAAAVLYGTGARLDDDPALLFRLRGITPETFFDIGAAAETAAGETTFSTEELSGMFGIDLG